MSGQQFNAAECGGRQPHAVLDLPSRRWKGEKIERLLGLEQGTGPIRLLEIGTGSGGIAHYFGSKSERRFDVTAVDVVDQRQVLEGYRFVQVHDTNLPFADDSFDVVLTNHVIEHVGDRSAQLMHLREVRRVMAQDGIGYLAVPNRWQLVEPHYRLAFLSWLPERWRSPYLRWRRRGPHYDCRPLTVPQLEALLREAGFTFAQQHGRALRLTYRLERPDALAYRALFRWLPEWLWALARRAFPTLIYVVRPTRGGGHNATSTTQCGGAPVASVVPSK